MKFNSNYFINEIFEPINEMITPLREAIDQKIILHFENARPHNSQRSDIAPSDFYLFGYIKKMLQGHSYDTPDDLLSVITEILNDISPDVLIKVCCIVNNFFSCSVFNNSSCCLCRVCSSSIVLL